MSASGENQDILAINHRMADSLQELARVLQAYPGAVDLSDLAAHMQAGGNMKPHGYGQYFRLIRALQDGSDTAIQPMVKALAKSRDHSCSIAIRMLGFHDFGRVGTQMLRADYMSESLAFHQMGSVPRRAHARVKRDLRKALGLIQTRAPKSWSDVSRVTSEIIAAYGNARNMMNFDGCSSLERHGAILLNMRKQRTPLALAETLVHESAHGLLFALSCNDHRVLNPHTERYASPLRIDPRPLDGIYHAVFVLARMYSFLVEVAQNPDTTTMQRAEARSLAVLRKHNFFDGYDVLQRHARLTPTGQTLLDDAVARVEAAA